MDLNMEALNIGCGNKHWSQSDIDLIDWLHNKPGRYGAGSSRAASTIGVQCLFLQPMQIAERLNIQIHFWFSDFYS